MFSKALTNLALASDIADSAFPKISGLRFDGDESLIATLRAQAMRFPPDIPDRSIPLQLSMTHRMALVLTHSLEVLIEMRGAHSISIRSVIRMRKMQPVSMSLTDHF